MTEIDLARLKQITQAAHVDWDSKSFTTALRDFYDVSCPSTIFLLIERVEKAEHRAKRYKALAETRLETIQRVRDLAARLEGGDHPLGRFIAKDIRQALEGDPK